MILFRDMVGDRVAALRQRSSMEIYEEDAHANKAAAMEQEQVTLLLVIYAVVLCVAAESCGFEGGVRR